MFHVKHGTECEDIMEDLKNTMANATHKHGFTHNYCFGVYNGVNVYAVWIRDITANEIAELAYVDRPAPEVAYKGVCLRFKGKQVAAYKLGLRRGTVECIGTKAAFKAAAKKWQAQHKGLTMGHFFEAYIASLNGIKWSYQQDDGRLAPDLTIDNVEWQLKFNGGNFITEDQMLRWA